MTESPKPDTKSAVGFLASWAQGGPWVLTAIQTDRKSIETRTFTGEEEARKWIDSYNGKRNIYFHVNPTIRPVQKKAEREDIKSVDWLHVDIDPRAGEDLEEERKRALSLLTERLPKGVPPPTVVVFSGGGYQGFWKLISPIPINGDLAAAEDAKRFNQQLEALFGADNCHNIDRIMRLPGTINLPDAKKKKKGRQPTLAKLVDWQADRVYDLSMFTPAPAVQMGEGSGFSGSSSPEIRISGNVKRLASVDELNEWNVPDRVKVIIVQGRHPDEPKKGDNSRSAWVFDVCCQLVRANVPDETIFSILTDPDFGISESILNMGSNAEKYAIRQIERAKEEAVDPWLRKMNEQFAVIGNLGGKCRIIEEVMDYSLNPPRPRLTRQSFEDLRNRFMNKEIQIGMTEKGVPITMSVGKWWLLQEKRRQYDTMVFAPGKEISNTYNLWKGFSCQAIPGNCSLFLNHVRDNLCSHNDRLYDYVLGWMARCVQQPDSPGQVAIVLKGLRGVGKSIFAKVFGSLFGRHFMHISNPSHLIGNFNSHLRDTVVLFADEAFYAGDRKHTSILKTLITEETITIEAKGVDAETCPNYVHLIMASNNLHIIPAGPDERRFLVLDVGKEHKQDGIYFNEMMTQMEKGGGREALLHFLLHYDLVGYDVRKVPSTQALQEQKLLSLEPEEEWWFDKLQNGQILKNEDGWLPNVKKDELLSDYIEYTDRFRITKRGNATAIGRFIAAVCPGVKSFQKMATIQKLDQHGNYFSRQVRCYFYKMPTLEECRKTWEELYGETRWPANQQLDIPPVPDKEPF